jgi:hypothetical protein
VNGVVIRFATVIACLVLAACASSPPGDSSGEPDFALRVEDRDATAGRFMIYDLTGDGTMAIGSGASAQEGLTNESVVVGDEDFAAIRAAVVAAEWPTLDGASTGAGPRRLEVRLRIDGRTRRFEVLADGRDFDAPTNAVLTPLESIARRRFGSVLNGLPRGK